MELQQSICNMSVRFCFNNHFETDLRKKRIFINSLRDHNVYQYNISTLCLASLFSSVFYKNEFYYTVAYTPNQFLIAEQDSIIANRIFQCEKLEDCTKYVTKLILDEDKKSNNTQQHADWIYFNAKKRKRTIPV